jgi:RNA polymerase sigma-70 factor (ECF subfamily)
MTQPRDWNPERYLDLVCLWARQLHLNTRFQRRFGTSDVVQETMMKAHEKKDGLNDNTEPARIKWLHQIFRNQLADMISREKAQRRDLDLEQTLPEIKAESSARLERWLASDQSSPSKRVEQHEQELLVAAALNQLPEDQRDVMILRDLMDTPVKVIALQLGYTRSKVAGLLFRGRCKFREIVSASH